MTSILLSTSYFPPVQYLSKLKNNPEIYIEQFENFGKQSYRNRCEIMTANGLISLTVPVEKANSKILTRDMRINYDTNWQKMHFKGIESAYKNSPYYEYYIDDFGPFFDKRVTFLLDLNLAILNKMMEFLHLFTKVHLTTDYIPEGNPLFQDFRNTIHPKTSHRQADPDFIVRPYRQTFCDRFPFTPNLSGLDLLFCAGPDAQDFL